MKKLFGKTEGWLGLMAIVITGMKNTFWPDIPISDDVVVGLVAWIVARLGKKAVIAKAQGGG